MAVSLWLVRHGETAWSRDRLHTSVTDVPLTPAGAEAADAPLAHELEARRVRERQRRRDVAADQVGLAEAGQLEDPAPDREHTPVPVADDEPGGGGGVVVLEQLEEEAEAAAPARGRVAREPLGAVDVDRPLAAVRADVDRHLVIVGVTRRRPSTTRPC